MKKFALVLLPLLPCALGCSAEWTPSGDGTEIVTTGTTAQGPHVSADGSSKHHADAGSGSSADAGIVSSADAGSGSSSTADAGTSKSSPDAATAPTSGGSLAGMEILNAQSAWNQDISGAAVDPDSATYIAAMAPTASLHPDFSNFVDGNYGIPFVVVNASQPLVPITFTDFADESDAGPYPIPLTAPIENGLDQHVIAVDIASHTLYELYSSSVSGSTWTAQSGAKFDLTAGDAQRPVGWTSADAAGLPIFPGLARADEVVAGEITHALRFTMVKSQAAFVAPATHFASSSTTASLPPMGLRVRLKASVDISSATKQAKVVLTALKKYGMILADNGSNWYVSGAPDARWDDDDLHTLGNIKGSDFEVVAHGALQTTSP